MPGGGTIFGVPADAFLRVGLPILAGTLTSASVVAIAVDAPKIGTLLAIAGGLLGGTLAVACAIRDDQDRVALERTLLRLEAHHAR